MSKATCKLSGKIVYLTGKSPQGTDLWTVKDAIHELMWKLEKEK